MCYIHNALDAKASAELLKFVRTIYILIGTMVSILNKQLWKSSYINLAIYERTSKFLSIPSFLNNEISQAIWARLFTKIIIYYFGNIYNTIFVEFDPGSGQTLAACFKHASRTEVRFSTEYFYMRYSVENLPLVADGWVTRE